jgi:hypothetical protein
MYDCGSPAVARRRHCPLGRVPSYFCDRSAVAISDGAVTRLTAGGTTPAKQAEEQSGEEQTKPGAQPEAGTDFEEHT